jgi:hypothetical protein
MARIALVPQPLTVTGSNPATAMVAATADGYQVPNTSGLLFLDVNNASGVSVDVTLPVPITVDGLAVSSRVVAVPAGARRLIGGITPDVFNRPAGDADVGDVFIDVAPFASVTVGAFRAR